MTTATELGFRLPAVGLRLPALSFGRELAAHGRKQEAEFCCSCQQMMSR